MSKATNLANDALDAMELCRIKLQDLLNELEGIEGSHEVVLAINKNAFTFIKAYTALEDIYSDVEDLGE